MKFIKIGNLFINAEQIIEIEFTAADDCQITFVNAEKEHFSRQLTGEAAAELNEWLDFNSTVITNQN